MIASLKFSIRKGLALFMAALWIASASAQTKTGILRLVSYNIDCADQSSDANITGSAHSLPTVIQGIALHHLGTNVQQIDTLNVEELNSTTLPNFTAALTNIYGWGAYAYDTTVDNTTGGGTDGLIYNTRTMQVISGRSLPTGETVLLQSNGTYTSAHSPGGGHNGVTRGPLCYHLRPIGFGTNNDFYMYISHARSSSDDSVGDARYAEAQEVRSDAKYNVPAGSHILYAGDWNLFNGSGENAYKCLTGQVTSDAINWADTNTSLWANTNQTQGYDPTSKTSPPTTTTWANLSTDHANYLYDDSTQSGTYATTSRLDIQLPNALMYGAYNSHGGVQITPNYSDPYDPSNSPASQYHYAFEVFGNNGSVPYGDPVTQAGNTSLADLADTIPSASTLINDIVEVTGSNFSGSDHYPIFGDYTIVIPQQPPVAGFIATPTNGIAPLTVTFTDASTGNITGWSWAFGDGSASITTNTNPNYIFTNAGNYTVTETVTGPGGSNSVSQTITVLTGSPVAAFIATPTNGVAPLTVAFTDFSTGNITGWSWAFGDGSTNVATDASPNYTFTNAGAYTVTETVSGPGGSNSVSQIITVLTAYQAWQLEYFGCDTCPPSLPDADADGTGQNNWFKYVAGLNPTNPASVFAFGIAGTNLTFSPVTTGRTYTVLYATNLPTSVWLPLTSGLTNITDSTCTVRDTDTAAPRKFYMMQISMP